MKSLVITTQRHPLATSLYAVMAILGFLYISGQAQANSLEALLGHNFTVIWAWSMMAFGIGSIIAVLMSVKRLRQSLYLEATSCIALTLLNGSYVAALYNSFQFKVATTEIIFAVITVGFFARSIQAFLEAGRVASALAHPTAADPPPLAESPKHSGR